MRGWHEACVEARAVNSQLESQRRARAPLDSRAARTDLLWAVPHAVPAE
jgi:hypothetical protein